VIITSCVRICGVLGGGVPRSYFFKNVALAKGDCRVGNRVERPDKVLGVVGEDL